MENLPCLSTAPQSLPCTFSMTPWFTPSSFNGFSIPSMYLFNDPLIRSLTFQRLLNPFHVPFQWSLDPLPHLSTASQSLSHTFSMIPWPSPSPLATHWILSQTYKVDLRYSPGLRSYLMFGDVDEQFSFKELFQNVLRGHVDQCLLCGWRHSLLNDDDCSWDVLLLHSLAVWLHRLDSHFWLLGKEDKHLIWNTKEQ